MDGEDQGRTGTVRPRERPYVPYGNSDSGRRGFSGNSCGLAKWLTLPSCRQERYQHIKAGQSDLPLQNRLLAG